MGWPLRVRCKAMNKIFVTALMAGALFWAPAARAQSEAETQLRLSQIEEQMRQLVGQMEELSFQLKQTQQQLAGLQGAAPRKKLAAAEEEAPPPPPKKKMKIAAASEGVEEITGEPQVNGGDEELMTTITNDDGTTIQVPVRKAPGAKVLGTLDGSSTDFGGQVIVPLNDGEQQQTTPQDSQQVETVALGTSATDTPESVYERSYESLLRRQFGEAEGGFQLFLDQYRDHSLAGNAQYWLGETYYVQGQFKQAAQNFLTGFKQFPKSRKAPDSLLKLGMSLDRLGQKDQACAAFAAVGDRFPKAADAKKRSMVEQKRAGC